MNCHRESYPGLGKSLAGRPDQRECRWLAIRCRVGQESYVRQQEENKRDDLASISAAPTPTQPTLRTRQREFQWAVNGYPFDKWFVTNRRRNF